MARTLTEIYNELTASKESYPSLNSLLPNPDNWSTLYTEENFKALANTITKTLSASKVAIWRLIMYIVAFQLWVEEKLMDTFQSEVEDTILKNTFGQLPWYVERAKEWQYGDTLTWDSEQGFIYTTTDTTKQIITQASASVSSGQILLKVAKGAIGSLSKLSTTELSSFEDYVKGTSSANSTDGIAPAGTNIAIISDDADDLKMAIEVFYDPLVLNDSGVLISDGSLKPVEVAITNYIQQIGFNSLLRVLDLVDAIQSAQGVTNVVIKSLDARYGLLDYTNILLESGQQYLANAGYLAMATNHALDGYYDYPTNTIKTITYTKQ